MRLKDHLNKLEYFCIVVESGSMKKASETILIGQPQLTKVIKQLEDILGTTLFLRSSKGVTLTKAGDQLYTYSKQILQKANEAEFTIKSHGDKINGIFKIGTYDSIARYFFPDFIKYLKTTAPDVKIFLQTGRSSEMYKKLKKKEIDIAVIVDQQSNAKKIESRTIYTDAFGLYKSPTLSTEFYSSLIYFPYPQNDVEASMSGFGFTESILCDNLETVRSLTEQAIGIGLLPHKVAKESVLARKIIAHHHPKIKTNTFDYHKIMLCHSKEQITQENLFVLEEIERFLQIWSKS